MDFLYERMKRDILYFYDHWYIGNVNCMKNLHVELLTKRYDPNDFKGLTAKELRRKKHIFLTNLQNTINKSLDCR